MRSGAPTRFENLVASPEILDKFQLHGEKYRWYATITVSIPMMVVLLTVTSIDVAIPEIMTAFSMDYSYSHWLISGYLAANTLSMLLAGWLVNSYGMKSTMLTGLSLFTIGLAVAIFSNSSISIIISRIIQGIGAGFIPPIAMMVLAQIFPKEKKSTAMGLYAFGAMLGPAVGPSFGGYMVDILNWRFLFISIVPIALITIPLTISFVPGKKKEINENLDVIGLLLLSSWLCVSLALCTYINDLGMSNIKAFIFLNFSIVLGLVFILWINKKDNPILDIQILKNHEFKVSAIISIILGFGLYTSTYLIPLYLQNIQGFSPTGSGLMLLLPGIVMAIFFIISGVMGDLYTPQKMIILGAFLFSISSFAFMKLSELSPIYYLITWIMVGRIGLGIIFPNLSAYSISTIPLKGLAKASSSINFFRQLGGALGIAIYSIYFSTVKNKNYIQLNGDFFQSSEFTEISKIINEDVSYLSFGVKESNTLYLVNNLILQKSEVLGYAISFVVIGLFFFAIIFLTVLDKRKSIRE